MIAGLVMMALCTAGRQTCGDWLNGRGENERDSRSLNHPQQRVSQRHVARRFPAARHIWILECEHRRYGINDSTGVDAKYIGIRYCVRNSGRALTATIYSVLFSISALAHRGATVVCSSVSQSSARISIARSDQR